jgi:hypothetical protein
MALSSITKIPGIMRANSWTRGAWLMDRWFAGAPFSKPFYTSADLTDITMDWVLGFRRAEKVFDAMADDQVWSNDKARPVMAANLRKLGLLKPMIIQPQPAPFDFSSKSVQDQHDLHVNFREVEYSLPLRLDDLTAALGNFSIYVVPLVGDVTPVGIGYMVKLYKIGFHVMDSYDFEGFQFLGFWDEDNNSVVLHGECRYGACAEPSGGVTNDSFREWRSANRKGGDFQVYSDVKEVPLNPPDMFLI